MKRISRICLFGALTLVLLTAACAGQEVSPTPQAPALPGNQTAYPPPGETEVTEMAETATASPEATLEETATSEVTNTAAAATDTTETAATATTPTPGIPVTGLDVILLECQFCIEGMAQALLVMPESATFETMGYTASLSTPGPEMGCNTIDTFNGRQIVLCRGAEGTSLNLNICVNGTDCTQLLVELQDCPDQPGLTDTPGPGEPTSTPGIGVPTATPGAVDTDTPGVLPTNSPNAGGG